MSGPFYFAWVDPAATTFDPVAFAVEDEKIVTFTVEHHEGDVATLSIDVKNPKIGLLAPGRKIWAWLSFDTGSGITPIFFGRLVGIPTNMVAEVCTLSFVARPVDYAARKQAIAETLKVRPFYDPVWLDENSRDDPDAILEAYSALFHVDRITHAVTVSDIILGEDGVEIFDEIDSFYDSVSVALNETPLTSIAVDGTVNWTQAATGVIDLGSFNFKSNYGASLFSGWPKAGTSFSSGWSVESGSASDIYNISAVQTVTRTSHTENKASHHNNGDWLTVDISSSGPVVVTQVDDQGQPIDPGTSIGENELFTIIEAKSVIVAGVLSPNSTPPINTAASINSQYTYAATWAISGALALRYNAARQRSERVVFTLSSDLQAILTDQEVPGTEQNFEVLSLTGADLDKPLTSYNFLTGVAFVPSDIPGFVPSIFDNSIYLPIHDPGRRSYFPTDRGEWSIEYLIARARARLLMRSRVVEVTFDCRFERALALSCRKNAVLRDHRLPGGEAVGKVIGYTIKGDGDAGSLIGTVTISSAIGYGSAIVSDVGVPSYVADGYVDDYQHYDEAIVLAGAGDVGYTPPLDAPIDDGLVFPLTPAQVIISKPSYSGDPDVPVNFTVTLKPLDTGPFAAEYDLVVSKLMIPDMIDLEAPSA